METLLNRIRTLCEEKNISIRSLEKHAKLSNGSVKAWDNSPPSCYKLYRVAKFLDVSMEWLITGDSQEKIDHFVCSEHERNLIRHYRSLPSPQQLKVDGFIEISSSKPLFSVIEGSSQAEDLPIVGYVAAGQPILAIENPLSFTTRINQLVNYALYIKGDSMDPVIKNGETVQVISQKTLENGEIGIIKIDDSATCKRFYRDDHSIKLVSFNPEYEPLIYDSTSTNDVQILGKIVLTDAQRARIED